MNLSPLPIQRAWDNNGLPLARGLLFTYTAGTTTKAATYTDSTGGTPNTNPINLNARGEAQVWIDPTKAYKFVLAPLGDTDPPTSPIWTVDQIESALTYSLLIATLTQAFIGSILYPRTTAEIALGITPTAYQYAQLDKQIRYGPVGTLSASNFKALSNRQLSIRDVDPAAGTGSAATDTAAIIAAAAQLGQIGTIYFPYNSNVGYSINPNAITFAGPIRLKGEGRGTGSWLIMNGFASGDRAFTWDAGGSYIIGAAMEGFYVSATNNNGSLIKLIKTTGEFRDIFTEGLLDFCDATQGFSSTFTNIKTRNNRRYSAVLRDASNDIVFDRCDFDGVVSGAYGIYVVGGNAFGSAAVTARNSRFEGFAVAGSHPIVLAPAAGEIVYDFVVRGCYFEGSHDEDIVSDPADAKGVRRLVIEDNSFFGSVTSVAPTNIKNTQGVSVRKNRVNAYTTAVLRTRGGNISVTIDENTADVGLVPYSIESGTDTAGIFVNHNLDTTNADIDGTTLSPAQITANQNDYSPTGMLTFAKVLRLNTDAARNITGLTGGLDKREVKVFNVGGFDMTLTNEDAASTAGSRFAMGANQTLNPGEGITLWYDGTSSRWRAFGRNT